MNAEVKAKWVEALRSGDYKQGTGMLRRDDRFCCLGVLCDVVEPQAWQDYQDDNNHDDDPDWYHHGCSGAPGIKVTQVAEIPDSFPPGAPMVRTVKGSDFYNPITALAQMNDKEYLNFNQIADWIEANL